MPQSCRRLSHCDDGSLVEQKRERMGENGEENNQCFYGLFALKAGRPDDETANKAPTCANDNEDRHEIHDPRKIIEEIRIFQTGKPKTFGQDKEKEIKQDENKESPGH